MSDRVHKPDERKEIESYWWITKNRYRYIPIFYLTETGATCKLKSVKLSNLVKSSIHHIIPRSMWNKRKGGLDEILPGLGQIITHEDHFLNIIPITPELHHQINKGMYVEEKKVDGGLQFTKACFLYSIMSFINFIKTKEFLELLKSQYVNEDELLIASRFVLKQEVLSNLRQISPRIYNDFHSCVSSLLRAEKGIEA